MLCIISPGSLPLIGVIGTVGQTWIHYPPLQSSLHDYKANIAPPQKSQ
jgi:hypothetical protein